MGNTDCGHNNGAYLCIYTRIEVDFIPIIFMYEVCAE